MAEHFWISSKAELLSVETPETILAEAERADLVRRCVAGLTRRHARLIALHYWDGRTLAEIAMAFGVSEPAVSVMHRRALRRLRASLALMGMRREDAG